MSPTRKYSIQTSFYIALAVLKKWQCQLEVGNMIGWSYNEESLLSTRLPHQVFEPLGLVDTRNLSVVSYQIPHSQGPQGSAREN